MEVKKNSHGLECISGLIIKCNLNATCFSYDPEHALLIFYDCDMLFLVAKLPLSLQRSCLEWLCYYDCRAKHYC